MATPVLLLLIGVAVVVMIPAGLWVTRQITGPLHEAIVVANAVAGGAFDNRIDNSGTDEPAQLMQALTRMQEDLKARTEEERRVASEALCGSRWRSMSGRTASWLPIPMGGSFIATPR